jgi:hypothetical protein
VAVNLKWGVEETGKRNVLNALVPWQKSISWQTEDLLREFQVKNNLVDFFVYGFFFPNLAD